jgi:soluble lytic murein transglycosylase
MPLGSALDDSSVSGYNAAVNRRRLLAFLCLIICVGAIGTWRYCLWRDHRFDVVIVGAAQRYGVAPALVKAVVWRESRFNPSARGRKSEFGLMQIRAEAAGEWARAERIAGFAPEQLLDPATNTLAGTWYLGKLLKRYQQTDDPLPYALADYNAGRSHVLRWNKGVATTNNSVFIEQMDFPGTRKYVKAVMRRYEHYRARFPEHNP